MHSIKFKHKQQAIIIEQQVIITGQCQKQFNSSFRVITANLYFRFSNSGFKHFNTIRLETSLCSSANQAQVAISFWEIKVLPNGSKDFASCLDKAGQASSTNSGYIKHILVF